MHKAIMDRPKLRMHLGPVYHAFCLLSASRPITMGGVGAVALSEILTYFSWKQITNREEQEDWLYLFRQLDAEYCKFMAKRAKEANIVKDKP